MKKEKFIQDWKYADWDEVKKAQLKEMANLPLSKKIEWLEQMQEMIDHMTIYKKEKKNNL